MKQILLILALIIFFNNPVYAKKDIKPNDFNSLGRYIENLEINEKEENEQENKNDEFEDYAIYDVAKRYENNAVELKLDTINNKALEDVNSGRIFNLQVNETQFNIENGIKNENMIWDDSKLFTQSYFTSSRHLAPIPGVVNSSKITADVNSSLSAQFGQTYLNDANGPTLLFVRANESTYNTGAVITYKGDKINFSTGSFSSSYNHASSGGAVISSNSLYLPNIAGSFVIGSGYFANEGIDKDKSTTGGFLEYTYKRFKINAQMSSSKFNNSDIFYTGLYLIPEFKISNSLYLKTRFIRNITDKTMQDELALTYKPKNNKNDLELEINTSNQYTNSTNINQRIKFSASFKI